jgi:S-(hydroxymethyl)glutathione dehydrogenase/alcohol dehydrogenase
LTWGKNCDVTIITTGVLTGELVEQARSITAKGGVIVSTAMASHYQTSIELNMFMFNVNNQELRGSMFGSENPRIQIPRLLRLHNEGKLFVDELVTQEYAIDEVQKGYDDLESGKNIRGVVRY